MIQGTLSKRTEQFLVGLYEMAKPLSELLARIDFREFSWIGTGKNTFFDSQEAVEQWWKKRQLDEKRPLRHVEELQLIEQPLSDAVTVVLARWKLTGKGEEPCRCRATFVYFHQGGRIALEHIHLSRPWGLVWGRESFPITVGRINYEYLTAVQRTESHRKMPRVPAKQRRVLYYLRSGMTYREIGEIMGISPRTVRYYVSELIQRFHVENRAQLLAASQGLTEKELSGTGEDRK